MPPQEFFVEKFRKINAKFTTMNDRISDLEAETYLINKNLNTLMEMHKELMLYSTTKLESFDEKFVRIDKSFAEMDKRFELIDKRFSDTAKKFPEIEKRFDTVDERLTRIENLIVNDLIKIKEKLQIT